jgi:hypothetical protein
MSQSTECPSRRARRHRFASRRFLLRTVPPASSFCLNPTRRCSLVSERSPDAPQHIYHLFVCVDVTNGGWDRKLLRTYASPHLAKHDAICWLMNQHENAGATELDYFSDLEYEEDFEGLCGCYCTTRARGDEIGCIFSSWTGRTAILKQFISPVLI